MPPLRHNVWAQPNHGSAYARAPSPPKTTDNIIGDDGFNPAWAQLPSKIECRDPSKLNQTLLSSGAPHYNPQLAKTVPQSNNGYFSSRNYQPVSQTVQDRPAYRLPPSPPSQVRPQLDNVFLFPSVPEPENTILAEFLLAFPAGAVGLLKVLASALSWSYKNGSAFVGWSYKHAPEISSSIRRTSWRFNPMGGRPRKEVNQTGSMLDLPPHMVGATPRVVRQARGEDLGPSTPPPNTEERRKWELFHATPMPGKANIPKNPQSTPTAQGNATPNVPATPGFDFRTPQGKKLVLNKEKFAMDVKKEEFKEWITVIHSLNTKCNTLKELLLNLEFPTDLILLLDKKSMFERDYRFTNAFNILIKIYTHPGFMVRASMKIPKLTIPEPVDFAEGRPSRINADSAFQQADGCCKFCRGYSWAGKVEVREVAAGQEVPCHSQHKSVKPYTLDEEAEFKLKKYDSLKRRWCRESRWDWKFEDPDLSKRDSETGEITWQIPRDDPRLRHVSLIFEENRNLTRPGGKIYPADMEHELNALRASYSAQDIASKIFLEEVKKEKPDLVKRYLQIDLERKRMQVNTRFQCVKQVKVAQKPVATFKEPAPNGVEKRRATDDGRSTKRVKFSENPDPPTTVGISFMRPQGILKATSGNRARRTLQPPPRDPTYPHYGPGSHVWHENKRKERQNLIARHVRGKTDDEFGDFVTTNFRGSTDGRKEFVFRAGYSAVAAAERRYQPQPYEVDPKLDNVQNAAARAIHDEIEAQRLIKQIEDDYAKEMAHCAREKEEDRHRTAPKLFAELSPAGETPSNGAPLKEALPEATPEI